MIVQWCVKGLALPDDHAARALLDEEQGLVCNWWRDQGTVSNQAKQRQLTADNLDWHVNHFTAIHPVSARPFSEITPFISLSAGTVERDQAARTNHVHRARYTALRFGSEFGARRHAYLYLCWVIIGPRPAVEVEGIAEEVRDLNAYRRYSDFQTEGEITAKLAIPDNQIEACEKWALTDDESPERWQCEWRHPNPRFTPPESLSNVRALI